MSSRDSISHNETPTSPLRLELKLELHFELKLELELGLDSRDSPPDQPEQADGGELTLSGLAKNAAQNKEHALISAEFVPR